MDVIFGVIRGKSEGLIEEDQIPVELLAGISLFIMKDLDLKRANTPFRPQDGKREWQKTCISFCERPLSVYISHISGICTSTSGFELNSRRV